MHVQRLLKIEKNKTFKASVENFITGKFRNIMFTLKILGNSSVSVTVKKFPIFHDYEIFLLFNNSKTQGTVLTVSRTVSLP